MKLFTITNFIPITSRDLLKSHLWDFLKCIYGPSVLEDILYYQCYARGQEREGNV